MRLRIALQRDQNPGRDGAIESSAERWALLADKAGHEVVWVDVYHPRILDQLAGCDGFMWRHKHSADDQAIAHRLLPVLEQYLGLAVYPDQNTCWHYDDKIAQFYLLQAVGIPTPETWVFWRREDALAFAEQAHHPLVLKLYAGAGSKNVVRLDDTASTQEYIRRLFYPGVRTLAWDAPYPGGWSRRLRDSARLFLRKELPNPGASWLLHKNYALFQEFLPGNAFDTRITVIGRRAFGFRRFNRPGDFRASGSGNIDFTPGEVDTETIRLAFRVAQALRTQSVAIDGLLRGNERVVNEVSYTYASWAVQACPGHWELDGEAGTGTLHWVEGPMWPEDAQFADFERRLLERRNGAP